MKDAGIAAAADVHFVQIKCPLLTKERIEEAARRGHSAQDSRKASKLKMALVPAQIDSHHCWVWLKKRWISGSSGSSLARRVA